MASRNFGPSNISNPWAILVLIIIAGFAFLTALIITIALYAPPLVLICGLFYNEVRDRRRQTSLTSEEADDLAKLESNLRSVRSRLAEIDEEGSRRNLKRNVDGSFHRGNKKGALFNNKLRNWSR